MGTLELAIPRLRQGSYFPCLLEPRRRSERALLSVVQQAYVEGVSTRRVEDLIQTLGCEGVSKSQVSRICAELDIAADATLPSTRRWSVSVCVVGCPDAEGAEDGRVVNVGVVIATDVSREGKRELLGLIGALLAEQNDEWQVARRYLPAPVADSSAISTSSRTPSSSL